MATTGATATADSHSADADAHHPRQEHHFASMEQQFDAAKMGMWIFLVTEILLFSGMFVAYAVFRYWAPEAFFEAGQHLDVVAGSVNTVVLLTSSLTIVLAVRSIQDDEQKKMIGYLAATVLLAGVFMVIKYFEYTHKFHLGIYPGEFYNFAELDMAYVPVYFSIYFVMTGIHGIHVLLGMALIGWLIYRGSKGHFDSSWYTPVEMVGLYWHIVDIIWIFLFPLLYLVD